MIGNDIVDLALAKLENNWKRPGYLKKIFSKNEIDIIQSHIDKDTIIWNLWTRKEAAYKLYVQETGHVGYFPCKINCFYNNEKDGFVEINNFLYKTVSQLNTEFIYSVSLNLATDFKDVINLQNRDHIFKKKQIPFFYNHIDKSTNAASITNHGRFEKIVMFKKPISQVAF